MSYLGRPGAPATFQPRRLGWVQPPGPRPAWTVLKFVARTRLLRWFNGGSDDTALLPLLLLKFRSVRILETIVCSGPLVWLFSPAWDAVILTLDVGFICPFVVIDPTDEGATTVVAPGRMMYNLLPIPDSESLPSYRMVLKLACVF